MRTLLIKSEPPVATTFPVIVAQPDEFVQRAADEPEAAEGYGVRTCMERLSLRACFETSSKQLKALI